MFHLSRAIILILLALIPAEVYSTDNLQISSQGIVFPVLSPRLSSSYGSRIHPIKKVRRHHSGVDLAAPEKSHVRAIMAGRVVFAGTLAGYGKVVSIQHEKNRLSLYGHLSEIHVETGASVESGKVIGLVGSTGAATGPHLHFEWRVKGKALDPLKIFPQLTEKPLG
jgi:murein DD-endopeptidase MepM/ murein hydrolase activator NlpD